MLATVGALNSTNFGVNGLGLSPRFLFFPYLETLNPNFSLFCSVEYALLKRWVSCSREEDEAFCAVLILKVLYPRIWLVCRQDSWYEMATDVDQICYEWSREELNDQDDSREITVSEMLDHSSISFGRFALEPLSWERRSVFTHNRFQEELEKFKAPGLVAQKKAYFEEYYKRIRAMKALEENKHTKASSNCDGIGCISGQIKDDQSIVTSENDGVEMISTIGPTVVKASTQLNLNVDGETALVELDSLATFSKDNKNGKIPPNLKHWQILDINLYHDEPMATSIVDNEQDAFIRVDNKLEPQGIIAGSISKQFGEENQRGKKSHGDELDYVIGSDREKASIEASLDIEIETALLETDPPVKFSKDNKMGENSKNSTQFQFLVQNSGDHEPIRSSIDDRKQHGLISQDNKEISKKSDKYATKDSFYASSLPKVFEDKSNLKKDTKVVKGFKCHAFSSEVMEHSSTSGDLMKSELQTKSVNDMRTQVLRDSSQKRNGKNNICIVSHRRTIDCILSSKHATVAAHGSKKEMHAMFTTRQYASVTGKQAASISASSRYDTKNILSSSSLSSKNLNSKGVSSRPDKPYIQKREKLENRRVHEPRREPLFTNRQTTHLKGESASNMVRSLKARSVNRPTSCKGDSNVGNNSNRITRDNDDGKRKLIEVMAPSRIRDLSVNVKSLQLGDNSVDRRKPRLEKPRWR